MKKAILSTVCLLFAFSPLASAQAPAVRALVDASTDVAIVEVKTTQPSKAQEGARDTARLEVIQTLKGPLAKGDLVSLYYHLLWADPEKFVLEKPKFEKGKRCIVFLKSHLVSYPVGTTYPLAEHYQFGKFVKDGSVFFKEFELTDQWLGVADNHPVLAKKIVQLTGAREKAK